MAGKVGSLLDEFSPQMATPNGFPIKASQIDDIASESRMFSKSLDDAPTSGSANFKPRYKQAEPINAKTHQDYEEAIRALYGESSFSSRQYQAVVDGKLVNGIADNVTELGGKSVAIEAKFVKSWAKSIRNPISKVGNKPFAIKEQQKVLSQARKYSEAFDEVIYHSNNLDFIKHYNKQFQKLGLKNVKMQLIE